MTIEQCRLALYAAAEGRALEKVADAAKELCDALNKQQGGESPHTRIKKVATKKALAELEGSEERSPVCNLQIDGKCTEYKGECGMTGENTCCLSCPNRQHCEDPCEYAREEGAKSDA